MGAFILDLRGIVCKPIDGYQTLTSLKTDTKLTCICHCSLKTVGSYLEA